MHAPRSLILSLGFCLTFPGGPGGGAPAVESRVGGDPAGAPSTAEERPRARDAGIVIGALPTGPLNAITDVAGVRVGHATIRKGDSLRTGVTAVLPHGGNVFRDKVPAAVAVGNGFGKLLGLSQVNELGELETPVLLTGTLSVFRAADALLDTLLRTPGNEEVRSMNPVVGETNDGWLSDIRARPIRPEHVRTALRVAREGPVPEGSVGAGKGTRTLGFKGGIGTSSRRLPERLGGYTVGVLVQTNFGGSLRVDGVPVGRILEERGKGIVPDAEDGGAGAEAAGRGAEAEDRGAEAAGRGAEALASGRTGSVMIVVATDAPLAHRELRRMGARTFHGIARTGSSMHHGSGDYAIAFSVDRRGAPLADGELLSGLFQAAMEATEEAVLNALFRATAVTGFRGRTQEALPVKEVLEVLRESGALPARSDR